MARDVQPHVPIEALTGPALRARRTQQVEGLSRTTLVGMVLVRTSAEPIGLLVMIGPIAMLVPWTVTWLVLGVSWTAVGWVLVAERSRGPGTGWRVS